MIDSPRTERTVDPRAGQVPCIPGADRTIPDSAEWDSSQGSIATEGNLLRTVIDNIPDAIYVKDRQSRFILCNAAVLDRKGLGSPEEIAGKTDFDFYSSSLAAAVFADEQELMQSGRPLINQERCVPDRQTGAATWNLTSKVPLRDAEGRITGLVGIGRDITERKRVQEAYLALVDRSLQGLVIIQDQKIVFANRAMADISGYPVEEMHSPSAQALKDFIHPEDRETVWRRHRARLDGESPPDRYEFRVIRKDGGVRWVEICTSRIDYQGRPAIQAACLDVTERRQAEEALRHSEVRNRALLEAIPDQMFTFSPDGIFLDCRCSKATVSPIDLGQPVGRHVRQVFPPGVARRLTRGIERAVRTGHGKTLEFSLTEANRQTRDFECRLVACGDQEVLAIVRDISDRRRTERLSKLQQNLAAKLSSLSDLDEALRFCLEAAVGASQMDCGGIYIIDEGSGSLDLRVHLGVSEEFVSGVSSYPAASRNARAVLDGAPIYGLHDELNVPLGPAQRREGLRAMGIIPIAHDGRVVASLNVASHTIGEVPAWSRMVLETMAAQVGSAISRLKLQEALRRTEREKAIILDTMSEIVVYHDTSHRIIWANHAALTALGLSAEQAVGRRCYELWDGKTEPCAGCPVDGALRRDCPEEIETEGYNGGIWLVRGEPVRDAAGRVVGAIEMALDITKRKQAEDRLNERLAFETLLSELSATFVNLPTGEIDGRIERWLGCISEFLQLDRCVVARFPEHGDGLTITHSWAAPGLPRVAQGAHHHDCRWILTQLRRGEPVICSRIEEAPEEASSEKEYCRREGMKSAVVLPLSVGGATIGALAFSCLRQERQWTDELVQRLKLASEIIANALVRKQVEESLRRSEEKYRLVSENIPVVVYSALPDDESTTLFISGQIEALTGWTSDAFLTNPHAWADLIHPDDRDRVWQEIERHRSTRSLLDVEYRITTREGSRKWIRDRATSILDGSGQIVRIDGYMEDITDRKAAEDALRESEERFRELAELLPQTIFEMDAQGVFTFVNRAGLKTFGYTEAASGRTSVLDVIVPAEHEQAIRNVRRKMGGEAVDTDQYTARRPDGTTFPVLIYSSPIVRDGTPVGLRGIALDITERKRMEDALLESERKYRELYEGNRDGTAISDLTGRILHCNSVFLDMLGYAEHEIRGLTYRDITPPQWQERERQIVRQQVYERGYSDVFEKEYTRQNGSVFPAEVRIYLDRDSAGQPVGMWAVVRDMTERKRAEEQARQHLAELTRAWHVSTLGEMASGLAHELNQPLCAIVNYSNACLRLSQKESLPAETLRDSVGQIAGQAQRAADIIKRIRGLIAKREYRRTELDLEGLLADVIDMVRHEAARQNVAIVSRFGGDLPSVKGDSVEIQQVTLNLLRNAIEAMNAPEIAPRILTISAGLRDEGVEVTVKDTGRGIPPELTEKVFESFFTTKHEGLGVGLSLSRRIVEAHGGRLWAESDGPPGATFKFTLPIEGPFHGRRKTHSLHRG